MRFIILDPRLKGQVSGTRKHSVKYGMDPSPEHASISEKRKNDDIVETYKVGGLTLSVLAREHHYPPNEQSVSDVRSLADDIPDLVDGVDGGLFEYLPVELAENKGDLADRTDYNSKIDDRMAYFGPFQDEFGRQKKDVYVADPAFNWEWYVGRTAMSILPTVGAFAQKKIFPAAEGEGLTRRRFLSLAAHALGAAAVTKTFIGIKHGNQEMFDNIPTEYPFASPAIRRAVVARALKQMGDSEQFGGKTLLFLTPPTHWLGIKRLLEDTRLLERNYFLGTTFQEGPWAGRLNTIRHYSPKGDLFELVEKIPID